MHILLHINIGGMQDTVFWLVVKKKGGWEITMTWLIFIGVVYPLIFFLYELKNGSILETPNWVGTTFRPPVLRDSLINARTYSLN